MTIESMEWLPAEALSVESFVEKMRSAVRAWSEAWSAEGPAHLELSGHVRRKPIQAEWKIFGHAVSVEWNDARAFTLAGWALSHKIDQTYVTAMDNALLRTFAEQIARDFTRRFEEALGITSPSKGVEAETHEDVTKFEVISSNGVVLLTIALPNPQLILTRKRLMPTFKTPVPVQALVPLQEAMAELSVDYELWLGTATLSTKDAERIEVGDVLLLERRTDEPIPLCVPGQKQAQLHGILQRTDTHFSLHLCE